MTAPSTTPAIVEPLPAARSLVWWARALDVVSGCAVLLLISIVVFGGFRLRYGDLRITAQPLTTSSARAHHTRDRAAGSGSTIAGVVPDSVISPP